MVSLDSVDEIRTTHACSLYTPDARDTIHLRSTLCSAPSVPVVRGWRPAVRALKSRNTLVRCGPWQKVIRFRASVPAERWIAYAVAAVMPGMAAEITDPV